MEEAAHDRLPRGVLTHSADEGLLEVGDDLDGPVEDRPSLAGKALHEAKEPDVHGLVLPSHQAEEHREGHAVVHDGVEDVELREGEDHAVERPVTQDDRRCRHVVEGA